MTLKFSVVIPTYNSSKYLKECIRGFKNSKLIDEIIVGDDCSHPLELQKIKQIILNENSKFTFDIKLIESSKNNGAFRNKYNLIASSKNEWVYQIDSDNVPFPKIDKVISEIILNHEKKLLIYYPSKIIQFWQYKRMARILSFIQKKYIVRFSKKPVFFDVDKTKKALHELIEYDTTGEVEGSPEIKSKYVIDKHIFWVLNIGNFIVNKNQFITIMKPGLEFSREISSMDAVAFSYMWLKNDGKIMLHPSLSHYHRKRFTSVSYIEKNSSKISREYFTKQILSLPN